MQENGLTRKLRMTLEADKQIITIHILSNIPRTEGSQGVKFVWLMEYNVRNIFFKNHAENEAGRIVPA